MKEKFIVSKSNKLINGRYNLGVNEQKVIITMTSLIDINDKNFNKVTFTMKELSNILSVSVDNLYRDVRKIMTNLRKKDIFIDERDENGVGRIIETSFVTTAIYDNKHGLLTLEFSEVLKPYLLELKGLFTSYRLDNALNLSSKYSIRIYEKLKCNEFRKNFIWSIDELKNDLMLEQKSYNLYSNIKQKIILIAINDINKNTDIRVSFEEVKSGKKVVAIKFIIKSNKENRKLLKEDINAIEKQDVDIIENENVRKLKEIFKEDISIQNINKILESGNGDIEKIKKVYEYSKTQKIDNLVGFMIKMVKDDNFEEPIKSTKSQIHNFTERENYDYQKLEEGLLGWSDDELIKNESFKMDFKPLNDDNNNFLLETIRNVLEGQLTAIFGELRYKTWIKPSIDGIEIENNNVMFVFSNEFVKNKFENEFENIVSEIIKEIDENFKIKKM
ncbi:TPA: RepB family plasmid replication initiator protein [Clostridium perfringens]|nr:RepB family plasmid replication initiator protein [Clostridium perfringens]HBC2035049.1 RepB family plasmid replication initiator protein [Clostridium perfringens]HBC2058212.1 RepB family plasmid replication initiator protein [Clostridium perfringens]HBC2072363.1 RepB family plasmid replication initiator protein [Clostridium perfringens]